MANSIKSPLNPDQQKIAGEALQGALVDLMDLSLVGKQAHWNVYGRHFRSLHLQLDEVVDHARTSADTVAERAVAIGVSPDGRAGTIAKLTKIENVPTGQLADSEVVRILVDAFETVIARMRERIDATADPDPVTQDVLIGISSQLEKEAWMFQAELAH
ncbi:Dps family protein [Stackebrandtia soli]|uniref:Dps family protein n=1 Tax=Stackebrandtia soli TaxID=1892856 RepID=UPI0039ED2FB8